MLQLKLSFVVDNQTFGDEVSFSMSCLHFFSVLTGSPLHNLFASGFSFMEFRKQLHRRFLHDFYYLP